MGLPNFLLLDNYCLLTRIVASQRASDINSDINSDSAAGGSSHGWAAAGGRNGGSGTRGRRLGDHSQDNHWPTSAPTIVMIVRICGASRVA